MKTFDAEVIARDGTGHKVKAKIAQCAQCDGLAFGTFQIEGHDHFHLQCVDCGTSYCPQGGNCGTTDNLQRAADHQMITLAIAILSRLRPGWEDALRRIAREQDAEALFDSFRESNPHIKPEAWPGETA